MLQHGSGDNVWDRFSQFVTRRWYLVFVAWAALFAILRLSAPNWQDVARDGDFAYLPDSAASVQGEKLRTAAFGEVTSKSEVVFVLARRDGPLTEEDLAFADRVVATYQPPEDADSPIVNIVSHRTEVIGKKLLSPPGEHGQALLIIVQMKGEIMAVENMKPLAEIYEKFEALRNAPDRPAGLEMGVTGSGAVGTEMLFAAEESIRNTEFATIGLIIVILLLVYRAPLLAAVPLMTIAVAVFASFDALAVLAGISYSTNAFEFAVFQTTKIFVVVVLFGSGTDYCLFLIARYKEELSKGLQTTAAAGKALSHVGDALLASALTTILGLGMMIFADFGKFRNGGPAIALALVLALLACLTLAPAILALFGRKVFWPFKIDLDGDKTDLDGDEESDDIRLGRGRTGRRFQGFWNVVARAVTTRPGLILGAALIVSAPFVWFAQDVPLTYDLLNELGPDRLCVQGTDLLREYFPAGETGPVSILVYHPNADFNEGPDRYDRLPRLVKALYDMEYTDEQGNSFRPIQSVRSLVDPLGEKGSRAGIFGGLRRGVISSRAKAVYVSQDGEYRGKVARLDVIFPYDPFSLDSIRLLDHMERYLDAMAKDPHSPWYQAEFYFTGTPPGIRDLRAVTLSDQKLIQQLVAIAVLFVLIAILRRPLISVFLVASVIWGYFVTLGITHLLFAWLYQGTYHGLDWKLPTFLFVILVAVGEDYNIYLVTRVLEEQKKLGFMAGLQSAIRKSGGIITSCGLIMAGTFISMISGSLRTMHQLGFALALGVLLDTFVIRTIVVPSFLVLWGRLRRITGAGPQTVPPPVGPRRARQTESPLTAGRYS
ncbi:MAG: MMPL family transporter [Thermogutta sp.]|nr:MMPL family transporter [Thermogutta sp.]